MAGLMLAQGWERGPMVAALGIAIEDHVRAAGLVDAVLGAWDLPYPPGERELAQRLQTLWHGDPPVLPLIVAAPSANGAAPFVSPGLPVLEAPSDLGAWLDVTPGQLEWLADCDGRLARRVDRQGHYEQLWLKKRRGGRRLVEAPLPKLKAILTNCVRYGPSGQNRVGHTDFRAHLDGRVGWVQAVNPRRGLKLRLLFERIEWSR